MGHALKALETRTSDGQGYICGNHH